MIFCPLSVHFWYASDDSIPVRSSLFTGSVGYTYALSTPPSTGSTLRNLPNAGTYTRAPICTIATDP